MPYYESVKSKSKKLIILTVNRDLKKFLQLKGYDFIYMQLNSNSVFVSPFFDFLANYFKNKRKVKKFVKNNHGSRIIHAVNCTDVNFIYLLKKCYDSGKYYIYKIDDGEKKKNGVIGSVYLYYKFYSILFSFFYRIKFTPALIDGEPLICTYEEFSHKTIKLNNYKRCKGANPRILKKIVFILGHSFETDCIYYNKDDLKEMFLRLKTYKSNLIYKEHPGHKNYFKGVGGLSNDMTFLNDSFIPIEENNFKDCIFLSLNSTSILNLSADHSNKYCYLIDLLRTTNNWDSGAYKKKLKNKDDNIIFLYNYQELELLLKNI